MFHKCLLATALFPILLASPGFAQAPVSDAPSLAQAADAMNAKKMEFDLAQMKLQSLNKKAKKAKIKAARLAVQEAQEEYEAAKAEYDRLLAVDSRRRALEAQEKPDDQLSPEARAAKWTYLNAAHQAQELQILAKEARAKAEQAQQQSSGEMDPALLQAAQQTEEQAHAATLDAELKRAAYLDVQQKDLQKAQEEARQAELWSNLELQASFVYDLNRFFGGAYKVSDKGLSILGGVREKYYGLYGNLTLTYQSFEGFDESSHVYFGAFFAPRLFLPIIDPLTLYFTSHVGLRLGHESAFLLTHDAGAEYVLNPQFSLTLDLCSWSFSSNEQDLKIAFGVIFHPNAE